MRKPTFAQMPGQGKPKPGPRSEANQGFKISLVVLDASGNPIGEATTLKIGAGIGYTLADGLLTLHVP